MGLSSNTMAATLLIPSMAIPILILLLNPTISNASVNYTASEWCNGRLENCLVGDFNSDSEFLMETETSRMLMDSNTFHTTNTLNAERESVPGCIRPPRYDSCVGQKNNIAPPGNCGTYNRNNPCS